MRALPSLLCAAWSFGRRARVALNARDRVLESADRLQGDRVVAEDLRVLRVGRERRLVVRERLGRAAGP